MMDHRDQQLSNRSSSLGAALRLLASLAVIVVAIALVVLAWDDTGAATGDLPMRIFLVGLAVGAVIISTGFSYTNRVLRRRQTSLSMVLPMTVHHVVMGFVIGLAVGTTDWTDLRFAGWWQFGWTVPLLMVYVSLLVARRRSLGSGS